MVFENLTLFEIRLQDAQLGPRSFGRDDSSEAIDEAEGASEGRGRIGPLFALALVTMGLAVLWRRSQAGDDVDVAVEEDAGAEADLATAE